MLIFYTRSSCHIKIVGGSIVDQLPHLEHGLFIHIPQCSGNPQEISMLHQRPCLWVLVLAYTVLGVSAEFEYDYQAIDISALQPQAVLYDGNYFQGLSFPLLFPFIVSTGMV